MPKIGELRETKPELAGFRGNLRTINVSLEIELELNLDRHSDQAPSHRVISWNRNAEPIEVGSAWRRDDVRADGTKYAYLSMTVDDPSFAEPLHVAAFKNDRTGVWEITWRRSQRKSAAKSPAEGLERRQ